jgi:hypothetical protein
MGGRLREASAIVLGFVPAALDARSEEPAPAPIPVVVQVPARTYYVGQAIELRVGAEAAGERPDVDGPQIPNTEVSKIGTELTPLAATGIGNVTSERNLFVTRFLIIPRRFGSLRIPPVRARLGTRSGFSAPLVVTVQSLPVAGRPAEFLGGVGAFAVEAEASASAVRSGQDFAYSILVTGPAARGMQGSPSLARLLQVPLGLQVDPLPTVVESAPPSRRFRYRIRPTRSGTASLPPVAVAAFDPRTAHYVTRVTASIPIRVVEVPRFDPATLGYQPPPAAEVPRSLSASNVRMAAGLTFAIVAVVLSTLAARVVRRRWRIDPGRWITRRGRKLDATRGIKRAAREITEGLTEYLERSVGRPPGVLTPDEACRAITAATQDTDLGALCARLISDCDRVSYSDRETATGSAELVDEGRRLFEEIGRKSARGARRREVRAGSEKTRERQP